ncbi:MAG TPA: hypothetical protein PLX09_01665 [Xanthomonadaceae bacterium]|mgnify:CR=1 FL=1|nr:hypothetical protein [Xanthomonadaceae bacterium]
MRKTAFSRSALAAALAVSLSLGSAMAATDGVSAAFESEGVLHFQPEFKATGYALKIVGPGSFQREELFTDQDMLGVSINSLGQLVDGVYNYEISPIKGFSKRTDERAAVAQETPRFEMTSGVFRVVEGKVVLPETKTPEPAYVVNDQDNTSMAKDVVHADDVIAQGSICAGTDCVNNESFGFDTIRLKENNLRIKFDDTSSSGSFPNRDWQLTANDSANGGANKFSIDDITGGRTPFTIEAGAPSNSLYVDDGGRLGLGTSAPVVDVQVVTGNTPTLRLQQDGSDGFSQQTWDVAGNEANFFVRDVTNSSKLPFRIRPGAPTSSIDIAASGFVGMGTQSPASELHIVKSSSDNGPKLTMERKATTSPTVTPASVWEFVIRNNDGDFAFNDPDTPGAEFIFRQNGDLEIAGSLTANGSTFPDYVFEPSYKLMPLDDLQAYIEDNGHLPSVPSAKEVNEAGGHDMTALQLKLLEKVEELTLYTLQQQQTIKHLQGKLDELELHQKPAK